ncbi:MAG: replication factor C large subunit [Nanoarchaeota archaeon]
MPPLNSLPLIEKYRAKTFSEIKGQDLVIQELKTFFKSFPKKRALILNGPVGTGKTSMAIALAKEFDSELFELNASDLRNRLKLDEVLKPSLQQKSLFGKKKLILMDEADGITGSDRGGLPELLVLIDRSPYPMIITANDIWQRKFNLLRKKCQIITLKELRQEIIFNIISEILKKENKDVKLETQTLIAKKSKGDVRAALNDLQSIFNLGEDAFIEEIGEREKQDTIFNALKKIFQYPTNPETINAYDSTQMELDEIILWVEENIPMEYQGEALVKAYDALSRADLFKGRIYKQQYWRFLVYENFFLSVGISSATKQKSIKFTSYKKPSRILKIWLSNQINAKKKSIIEKYARFTHMSKKKANKEAFLIPFIIDQIAEKKLDLDEKETDWLKERRGAIIISNNLNRFRK